MRWSIGVERERVAGAAAQSRVSWPLLLAGFALGAASWLWHHHGIPWSLGSGDAWEYAEMARVQAPRAQEGLGARLREYNTKDALIAATHLALAAESLGLGSSFMNGYSEQKVKAVIGAADNDDIGVVLVMAVGRPRERGGDPGRLPLARTVFEETLAQPFRGDAE